MANKYEPIQDPAAVPADVLLQVNNVKKYFPVKKWFFEKKEYVKAVDDVTLSIRRGETLGIVGESGCGKSTLARCILQLIRPTAGQIIFDGTDITAMSRKDLQSLRKEMQIVFQDPYKSLHPRMKVGDIIEAPLIINKMGGSAEERRARVLEIMHRVGLNDEQYSRYPHEFSGGQRQRIVIARSLVLDPKLVLCDEPVSALDVSVRAQILNLLNELKKDLNLTYLFISHDLSVVEHVCDRIGIMYLGKLVELGTKKQIFENPVHPYTRALLSAAPDIFNPLKERILLQGDIPSPIDPPSGCRFHTRCFCPAEGCAVSEPEAVEVESGHFVYCHLCKSGTGEKV